MNSTARRRLATLATTVLAGAALAVGGAAAPAQADTGLGNGGLVGVGIGSVNVPILSHTDSYRGFRDRDRRGWYRYDDYETRRQCERAGWRGERRGLWRDYRCVRTWDRDRDWDRGDWDRRGGGRGGDWDRRGRHHDTDYVLWVQRSWRR